MKGQRTSVIPSEVNCQGSSHRKDHVAGTVQDESLETGAGTVTGGGHGKGGQGHGTDDRGHGNVGEAETETGGTVRRDKGMMMPSHQVTTGTNQVM
ncbi:hypothetical protein LSAT2_019952 [Lamellibrachia satsuma]|nr:hypothetical protein LSAT2_019952 [Lamellibrachia satsuma]